MKRPASKGGRPPPPKRPKLVHVQLGANQSETHHIVPEEKEDLPEEGKFEFLYSGGDGERGQRSFAGERPQQILRWIATVLFEKLPNAVEMQCYWHVRTGRLWISSNKWSVNKKIVAAVAKLILEQRAFRKTRYSEGRVRRHAVKLLSRTKYRAQQDIYDELMRGRVQVPLFRYPASTSEAQIDLHAERRIQMSIGEPLDPNWLGGVRRPCLICARALNLTGARSGPLWNSVPSLLGYDIDEALDHAAANGTITYVTRDRYTGLFDTGHGSDSDSGDDR